MKKSFTSTVSVPLIKAAGFGDIDKVILILDAGENVNVQNTWGQTALMQASFRHKEIVELLLDRGADPNLKDEHGRTALARAANNLEITKIILKRGADPDLRDENGNRALSYAGGPDKEEIIKLLITYKK